MEDSSFEVYTFAARICEMIGCKEIFLLSLNDVYEFSEVNSKFHSIGINWKLAPLGLNEKFTIPKLIQPPTLQQDKILLEERKLKNSVLICSNKVRRIDDVSIVVSRLRKLMEFSPFCVLTLKEIKIGNRNRSDLPEHQNELQTPNIEEFKSVLVKSKLNVEFVGLTADNSTSSSKKTATAIIRKNDWNPRILFSKDEARKFKVVALMTTYNEEGILRTSIMKLVKQGVGVYVIDNWSTDLTYEIAKDLEAKGLLEGCERFPQSGPERYFEYYKLAARGGEVASTLKADWFIYHDVDEIIVAPWDDLNLKEAIYFVDKMGYNAIDHTVIIFEPTDNGFSQGMDFEKYFNYFEFGKRPGHFSHIRSWKNLKNTKVLTLGHIVEFNGRKVFPYKFLLKHYPIRSQSHGEKKIFKERKARFNPEERKKGLHTHYDKYEPGCSFLSNPNDLIFFEKEKFDEEFLIERLSGIGIVRQ